MVKEVEKLTINPADYAYEITKTGKRDDSVENDRIHRQKTRRFILLWNTIQQVAMLMLNIYWRLLIML